jgi:hypothetical protein
MSYITDLGELYSESWTPGSPNLPGDSKATTRPQETASSLRMKGVFGSADSPANMASLSQASGQNPYEQEEEPSIIIDFDKWWRQEGGNYNFPSTSIRDACKTCAYNSWVASKKLYE